MILFKSVSGWLAGVRLDGYSAITRPSVIKPLRAAFRRYTALTALGFAVVGGAVQASETQNYVYDELGRLVSVTHSGTINSSLKTTYCHDAASNRTQYKSDSAGGTVTCTVQNPANLAIGNASVTEGGSLVFTVTRSGNTGSAVSASYATASGTATSGSDFTAGSGTVSFAANQTTATITVATIDDAAIESAETMTVTLSAPSSGATITTATGTGTINDNDSASPTYLVISDASALEGYNLTFTVTRSGSTTGTTTVNYATAPGTAATNDYTGVTGTLTFAPGETAKTISVFAKTDIRAELDEVFYVNLSGATGATINDAQGAGTIYDDGAGGCPLC